MRRETMSLRVLDDFVSELLADSYLWVWSDWSDRSMIGLD